MVIIITTTIMLDVVVFIIMNDIDMIMDGSQKCTNTDGFLKNSYCFIIKIVVGISYCFYCYLSQENQGSYN